MTKVIAIADGIIHISESKAECPYCTYKFKYSSFEKQYDKSEDGHVRKKCKCGRFVGITMTIVGDFVAYELKSKNN